jgi:microsomal epoxide hydrolase
MGVHETLAMIDLVGTTRLKGVVLVDDWVWTNVPNRQAYFSRSLADMARDRAAFTEAFVRGMYRMPQESPYIARIVRSVLETPTPTAYSLMASTYLLGRTDWRDVLNRIDRPLLFVGTPGTRVDGDTVRARVPSAQIEIFTQAGHAVFADEPARFNTTLEGFLTRIR